MNHDDRVLILLAAGVGSRISRHIGNKPKSLLELEGVPLIRRTVLQFKRLGFKNVYIATGFEANQVEAEISGHATCIMNPFYGVTNSVASMWFVAQNAELRNRELIIANADVFLTDELVRLIVSDEPPLMRLYADSSRTEDADYRFKWADDELELYGKDLSVEDTTGEYIGVAKISREYSADFLNGVAQMVTGGEYNKWWEDVIYREVGNGKNVSVEDVRGFFWSEMDYVEDYERTIQYISHQSLPEG